MVEFKQSRYRPNKYTLEDNYYLGEIYRTYKKEIVKFKVDTQTKNNIDKLRLNLSGSGYVEYSGINGRFLLHRYVLGAKKGQLVDHINGNKLDNRRENLRFVTPSQSARNCGKSKSNKSGYKGVYKNRYISKPWTAEIKLNRKKIFIGNYKTKELAAKAYNLKAVELHGEYAKLNAL